ncbi:MOSC domain-containing protein [Rhexocercosporidium sp. MPI-PUGE-AT-0058]|nr:MOSC domain-containing protein [Rhexocercosporidium sp. MPI-PUGE-AT-0058]
MMKIKELIVYPIKSIRGISLPSATLTPQGLLHDRRYLLLRPKGDETWSHMFIGNQPEMALFHCDLPPSSPTSSSFPETFIVRYRTPTPAITTPHPSHATTISIPFSPILDDKVKTKLEFNTSKSYPAWIMDDEINAWFTACFGYPVVLAFFGDNLGIPKPKSDVIASSWLREMKATIPSQASNVQFSDNAALLVTSEASLSDLHPRLPGEEKAIHEKFRPNIIVDGTEAWEEDFWKTLTFPRSGGRVVLTSNCARCTSVNVDLEHGSMGGGESGQLLKKMMKDRRIDMGKKWEPVFGRYGFPTSPGTVSVGDEVVVEKGEKKSVWNGLVPRLSTFEPAPASGIPLFSKISFKYRLASYIAILALFLAFTKMPEVGYTFQSWSSKHSIA